MPFRGFRYAAKSNSVMIFFSKFQSFMSSRSHPAPFFVSLFAFFTCRFSSFIPFSSSLFLSHSSLSIFLSVYFLFATTHKHTITTHTTTHLTVNINSLLVILKLTVFLHRSTNWEHPDRSVGFDLLYRARQMAATKDLNAYSRRGGTATVRGICLF